MSVGLWMDVKDKKHSNCAFLVISCRIKIEDFLMTRDRTPPPRCTLGTRRANGNNSSIDGQVNIWL
jgi:hypothetical protein